MKETKLNIDGVVKLLKIMGEKTRYMILLAIHQQPYCVCQLQSLINASQPAISQHLRKLRDADIVKEDKKGQWVYYSLNEDSEYYDAIVQTLKLAPLSEQQTEKLEEIRLQSGC